MMLVFCAAVFGFSIGYFIGLSAGEALGKEIGKSQQSVEDSLRFERQLRELLAYTNAPPHVQWREIERLRKEWKN